MASSKEKNDSVMLYAKEAEQSIVAALFGPDGVGTFDRISMKLVQDDFFFPATRIAFNAFSELMADDVKPDRALLATRIRATDGYDEGVRDLLTEAIESPYSMENIEAYAEAIAAKATGRKIRRELGKALGRTEQIGGSATVADVLSEIDAVSLGIEQRGNVIDLLESPQDMMMKTFERMAQVADGDLVGVKTGLTKVDESIGGFMPGDYVVVGARPSMGKTAFALKIGLEHGVLSVPEGAEPPLVATFSLEMEKEKLGMRLFSAICAINHDTIKNAKGLTEDEWSRMAHASGRIAHSAFHVDCDGTLTPGLLRGKLRLLENKTKKKVSLVIIDYLQLMDVDAGMKFDNRNAEVSYISRSIKKIAKQFGCPIIVLAQLNRSLESRQNKRPILSDLRESGAIEQDADTILFLYRDEYYDPDSAYKGICEVIAGKVRDGVTGTIPTYFQGQYQRFLDADTKAASYGNQYAN